METQGCCIALLETSLFVCIAQGGNKVGVSVSNADRGAIVTNTVNLNHPKEDIETIIPHFDFQAEMIKHAESFLPGTRKNIELGFTEWIGDSKRNLFIIIGGPGLGKTVIMAHLSKVFKKHVRAAHLCRYDILERRQPRRIILSLAYQLAMNFAPYRQTLEKNLSQYRDVATRTASEIWDQLLVAPLSTLPQPEGVAKIVLLIDALDESAYQDDRQGILHILRHKVRDLPSWVGVAVSSRPETGIIDELGRFKPMVIECDEANNQNDVRLLVEHRLTELGSIPDDEFEESVKAIMAKARGLFLYVKYIFEHGDVLNSLSKAQSLPDGLDDFYERTFERHFPLDHKSGINVALEALRPLLEIIVAAQRELNICEIATIMGKLPEKIFHVLSPISGLLGLPTDPNKRSDDTVVRFSHKSVRDWLVHADGRANKYH